MTSATQLNTGIAATIHFKLLESMQCWPFQPNALAGRVADGGNPLDMYIVTTDCYTIRFVYSLPKIQNRFSRLVISVDIMLSAVHTTIQLAVRSCYHSPSDEHRPPAMALADSRVESRGIAFEYVEPEPVVRCVIISSPLL